MNKFVVFDLDGTLIDTIEGITLAVNNTLENFHYRFHYSANDVKGFIGHGAKHLWLKATKKFKIKDEEFEFYNLEYIKTQYVSKVYDGVINTLLYLRNKGYKLIIYSNKPDGALQYLVESKLGSINWTFIRGKLPEFEPKPNPDGLLDALVKCKIQPGDEGFYVGDSYVDVETGKNAGLKTIACLYGYGELRKINERKPDFKIKKFEELKNIL